MNPRTTKQQLCVANGQRPFSTSETGEKNRSLGLPVHDPNHMGVVWLGHKKMAYLEVCEHNYFKQLVILTTWPFCQISGISPVICWKNVCSIWISKLFNGWIPQRTWVNKYRKVLCLIDVKNKNPRDFWWFSELVQQASKIIARS